MPAFTKAMLDKLGLTPAATTLQAVPPKEKGKAIPHTTVYHTNAVHQADLIFLPHDKVGQKTFKYTLVVVDLHSLSWQRVQNCSRRPPYLTLVR